MKCRVTVERPTGFESHDCEEEPAFNNDLGLVIVMDSKGAHYYPVHAITRVTVALL